VADRPITKEFIESEYPLSDKTDIFSYLKKRDVIVLYAQRTSDVVVTETGLEFGVKTYILMMPSIYGIGTSPLHEFCHVLILIRAALKLGKVPVVGDGSGVWDHVYIHDVAECYEFILNQILVGRNFPSGKDGIFFVETGEHSWRELSQRIAEAGVASGALKTTELLSISLNEAAETLGKGWRLIAEIGWASKYVYLVKQAVFIPSFS
jgi:nucleoside-diphosphate-sugar epimerase